jgi:hypothetical protein
MKGIGETGIRYKFQDEWSNRFRYIGVGSFAKKKRNWSFSYVGPGACNAKHPLTTDGGNIAKYTDFGRCS